MVLLTPQQIFNTFLIFIEVYQKKGETVNSVGENLNQESSSDLFLRRMTSKYYFIQDFTDGEGAWKKWKKPNEKINNGYNYYEYIPSTHWLSIKTKLQANYFFFFFFVVSK